MLQNLFMFSALKEFSVRLFRTGGMCPPAHMGSPFAKQYEMQEAA